MLLDEEKILAIFDGMGADYDPASPSKVGVEDVYRDVLNPEFIRQLMVGIAKTTALSMLASGKPTYTLTGHMCAVFDFGYRCGRAAHETTPFDA
jgi:hypothetical protein